MFAPVPSIIRVHSPSSSPSPAAPSALLTLESRYDGFTGLFGDGRGLPAALSPGQDSIKLPRFANSQLLRALFGGGERPSGLTLIVGNAQGGKTVAGAFMASELLAAEQNVTYIESRNKAHDDRLERRLLLPNTAATRLTRMTLNEGPNALDVLQRVANAPEHQIVFLDSLTQALPDPVDKSYVASLSDAVRHLKTTAVIGETPIFALCESRQNAAGIGASVPALLENAASCFISVSHRASTGAYKDFYCEVRKARTTPRPGTSFILRCRLRGNEPITLGSWKEPGGGSGR